MANYKDLKVWHKAMDLAESVHKLISTFPREMKYSLIDQLYRSAISIPSNIAEGHSRDTVGDFRHFLAVASGSLAEMETQLELAKRFGFASDEQLKPILSMSMEVSKMIWSLQRNIVK